MLARHWIKLGIRVVSLLPCAGVLAYRDQPAFACQHQAKQPGATYWAAWGAFAHM